MFFLILCVTVKDIMRHFTNMRTDHFELKNVLKTTPSGSGAAKILTPLQHLKHLKDSHSWTPSTCLVLPKQKRAER